MASSEKKNLPAVTGDLPALALANDLAGQVAPNVGRYLTLGLEGAENTRLAYSADLRSYEAFCTEHEFTPWPAAVATLASYVAHLADIPRKLATINRHLAAIEKNHQLLGLPSAISAPALDVLRKGVARVVGKKQKQAPAFSVAHLKKCIAELDLNRPEGVRAHSF
jgi:site-specific recombinase XerD